MVDPPGSLYAPAKRPWKLVEPLASRPGSGTWLGWISTIAFHSMPSQRQLTLGRTRPPSPQLQGRLPSRRLATSVYVLNRRRGQALRRGLIRAPGPDAARSAASAGRLASVSPNRAAFVLGGLVVGQLAVPPRAGNWGWSKAETEL